MRQQKRWTRPVLAALAAAGLGSITTTASAQLLAGVDEDAEYVQLYDFTRGRWVKQFIPAANALDLDSDGPSGLAVDEAGGVVWWIDGNNLYRSDYFSGTTTYVADTSFNGNAHTLSGLAYANGVLYGIDNSFPQPTPEGIYSINTTTGETTLVLDLTTGDESLYFFKGFDFNPVDGLFYVTNEGLNAVPHGLYSVNITTGAVSFVTTYAGTAGENGDVDGLAIGVDAGVARAYFVHDQIGEYAVYNLSTGLFETPVPSLPLAATEFNAGAAWAPGLVAPVVDNDLAVRIFDAPDFVIAGNQLTYTVEVENNGAVPLTSVVVTTTLDAGTSFASSTMGSHDGAPAGGVHTANIGTIPALGLVTYDVVVDVTGDGTLTASTSGASAAADPDAANNTASTDTLALPVPVNDTCDGAILLSCGTTVMGDTRAAAPESLPTCGTTSGTAGALWYSVVGTGAEITATTCNPGTNFNTRIRVWEGACDGLICIDGNDNSADPGCMVGSVNLSAKVTWPTTLGTTYYILVHGAFANFGQFELSVDCNDARGACCLGNACVKVTAAECADMSGAYQGDGTSCTPPTMTDTEPGDFIDIASTGTALGLVDNEIRTVTTALLGDLRIANDGAVAYGSGGGILSFTNASLPSDNFFGGDLEGFAVHWDDLDTEAGDVYWQEWPAGVVVQWHNRPHWNGDGLDEGVTFQAQLFAPGAPYRAQYIYADTTFDPDTPDLQECSFGACDDGGSATIGWQNAEGDFIQWSVNQPGVVVGRPCDCEFDGASGVNVFDLLAYLDLWFAGAAGADVDGTPGVDVFDLLAYLDCWFPASAGQPCGEMTVLTVQNPPSCP